MLACKLQNTEVVKRLLEHGADPNCKDCVSFNNQLSNSSQYFCSLLLGNQKGYICLLSVPCTFQQINIIIIAQED